MRSVLVTGCSDGGIGSALALSFAARGLLVFAGARSISKMTKLSSLPSVRLLELDVLKPEDIHTAVSAVKKETGGSLDYLVNNAGQVRYRPVLDEDVDEAKELFDVNVWSVIRMVQAFAPLLIESKGCVVYISSLVGYLVSPYMGTYAASKRATEILFDSLRLELAPFGVTTTSVVVGPVKSLLHSDKDLWKVPENSLYTSVEKRAIEFSKGNDGAPRQDTFSFAEGVVNKILKRNDTKFWAGANIGIFKWGALWLPQWLLDYIGSKAGGLDLLGKNAT